MSDLTLWGLFGSALVSSTLLPGGSEAYLVWIVRSDAYPVWLPVGVATLGNTLGGVITWLMGYWVASRYPLRTLDKPEHLRAQRWVQRWGVTALLLSWLPVVGDPLCFLAGWLKLSWRASFCCILMGKAARYAVLGVALSG